MENLILKNFQYSYKDALLWKNSMAHFKESKTGSLSHRVVHCLIGVAEFLPLIGQIISLFEKYMANKLVSKVIPSQINFEIRPINQINEQLHKLDIMTAVAVEKINSGTSPNKQSNEPENQVEEPVETEEHLQNQISSNVSISQPMEKPLKKIYENDEEIIEMLLNQGFEKPIERGGDGRCLFRSISPQITQEDIQLIRSFCEEKNIKSPHSFEDWCSMFPAEQADLLREVAIESEQQEIPLLLNDEVLLNEEEIVWVNEFYKDCLLQITQKRESDLRKPVKNTSFEEKKNYLKENYQTYLEETKNPSNYAGTTELIAILRVIQRQAKIYGGDLMSSKRMTVDHEGQLMPFFERKVGRDPIYIFQCWGGGHYRELRPLKDSRSKRMTKHLAND